MRNKYDKIFALKGWIATTEQGAKQLKKRYQSVSADKKEYRKENGIDFKIYKDNFKILMKKYLLNP